MAPGNGWIIPKLFLLLACIIAAISHRYHHSQPRWLSGRRAVGHLADPVLHEIKRRRPTMVVMVEAMIPPQILQTVGRAIENFAQVFLPGLAQ